MKIDEVPSYMRYWGKAKKEPDGQGADYHLLPYHCLDVAAVAERWWHQSHSMQTAFGYQTKISHEQTKAWLLFFIALHDYGKWDLRFQSKAVAALKKVNCELLGGYDLLNDRQIKDYYHGPEGLNWFRHDFSERFIGTENWCDDNEEQQAAWAKWFPWFSAVAGHHGHIPEAAGKPGLPLACKPFDDKIKHARIAWVHALEVLFLKPVGLSFSDDPPELSEQANILIAGFCSTCDWLGSSDLFLYDSKPQCSDGLLESWYQERLEFADKALERAGLLSKVQPTPCMSALLEGGHKARQIQNHIDHLPLAQNLTLIEASTGSGKTEAALAYAWRLLDKGIADSIVFALPTQATANAMFTRLEKAANKIFSAETNLILAHGRAAFNEGFSRLKSSQQPDTAQEKEEAWVHCSEWLSQSRKRVFLGQVGVCTVDQVLVSVLPVKHKFVRGFGIGRSVLIIDEVHAYDSYMYGLLAGVLEQQKACGGSAILLSATLPNHQKQELANAWGVDSIEKHESYPLISHFSSQVPKFYDLDKFPEHQPESFGVEIDLLLDDQLLPNQNLLERVVKAVRDGAQVCLICNLVDVAQNLYQQLSDIFSEKSGLSIDQLGLFHSRFSFQHRQEKEKQVVCTFGKDPVPKDARNKGHLLIATQVVEQSLDLDFDWMITQLCPVDLLFQRMGRLHRHNRFRPRGFEQRLCTVIAPQNTDYQLHELIYGNSRVLWRTQQLLEKVAAEGGEVEFPQAYRKWIEPVYQEDTWPDEPAEIQASYEDYEDRAFASRSCAKQLMNSSMSPLSDDDGNVSVLTRDGEMSLSLVPYFQDESGAKYLLDKQKLPKTDAIDRNEAINLNTVPVPASWSKYLPDSDETGLIWLEMGPVKSGYKVVSGNWLYSYSSMNGLQRHNLKQAETRTEAQ